MDKNTLSNYGWIVIAVLVLSVMIALATPFGSYISEAVQSTTKGLFDTNKNALDAAGITIDDNSFAGGESGGATPSEPTLNEYGFYYNQPYSGNIGGSYSFMGTQVNMAPIYTVFTIENTTSGHYKIGSFVGNVNVVCNDGIYTIDMLPNPAGSTCFTISGTFSPDGKTFNCTGCIVKSSSGMTYGQLTNVSNSSPITFAPEKDIMTSDGNVLYVYDESNEKNIAYVFNSNINQIVIQNGINGFDTFQIGAYNYFNCTNLTSITIPNSITNIGRMAFYNCPALETINYEGTVEQWNAITKDSNWNMMVPATEVICFDGTVSLS